MGVRLQEREGKGVVCHHQLEGPTPHQVLWEK